MRRRVLVTAVSVVMAVSLTGCWNQAGWIWGHTNDNTAESTLGASNIAGVSQKWYNASLSYVANSSVANSLVYVADGSAPAIESLSEATGAVSGFHVETGLPTTPAIGNAFSGGNGMVFTTETGTEAVLQAFDPDLNLLWSRTLPGKSPTAVTLAPNGASPTGSGNAGILLVTMLDTHIVVAYSDTGTLLGSTPAGHYSTPVAVGSSIAYVGRTDGQLDALTLPTLGFDWTAPVVVGPSKGMVASPSQAGSSVYAATKDGVVAAVDATTGALQWRNTSLSGAVTDMMAITSGLLYVTENQAAASPIYALNTTTGIEAWHHQDAMTGTNASGPIVANGLVYYYTGANGVVDALDAAGGTVKATVVTKDLLSGFSPVVSDGQLFVTGAPGLQDLSP